MIFVFLFLALVPAGRAAPDYFSHLWQAEDGLPQNAVTSIVQTQDGYLWLGTYSGLARFDGVRFAVFDDNTTPDLKTSRVTSLFEDASGNLWIGHETGELTRFKDGRFEALEAPAGWKSKKIVAISSDEAGDIWLVSDEGVLSRLRDGQVLVPRPGQASGVLAVARDTARRIWIVRDGKLSKLERGKLIAVDLNGQGGEVYVQGVCAGHDGGVWIASDGRVRKWRENRWAEDLGAAPWGLNAVTRLIETRDGSLVGGTTDSGLYLLNRSKAVLHFNQTNVLPQNWVRALFEDQEGNLWIGSGSAGLVALRAGKVAVITADPWHGRAVLSISLGRDGALWIGTEGAGLYRFLAGHWEQFGENEGLANPFVWSVAEDFQGRLWAGTWGGGIFVKRGNRFERPPELKDVLAPAPALLHAPNGVTWIGTGAGLIRCEAGSTTPYGEKEGLEFPDVRALAQAGDGTIWFGMLRGGLGRLSDGTLKQFRRRDGLSSDFVQCLKLDSDGTLWIGTAGGGLNRLSHDRFAAVTRKHGLADNVICHIEEDSHGYFWMGSHGGIMRVSRADLISCLEGATNWVNCITYGKGEGLPTLECSGGLQPSGCQTADGRLWFPTSKAVVVVDPNDVKSNQLAPPVVFEELLVDRQPLPQRPTGRAPVRIPPGRHQFEFHYAGLSFTVPEKVRFKYRVDGLEPEWSDAGTKRTANYSYIPPGDYTFRVIACNNDGIWNEAGASLGFVVLPFFWQTWWFGAFAAVAAAGAVAGSVLFGTRRRMRHRLERLERQRAVERERARIAKDIHDDLGASLTRITLLSQSARAELDHSPAAADVDRIYDTARELTRAMDEIVWAVNPQHDTLDSLATYLGRFAQDFLGLAHVRCRLDLPTQLPAWPLTAEVRHNLFLAFKEALNNALKHANTTEVHISLNMHSTSFVLCVEDKGCGFSPETAAPEGRPSGNGLVNMRQRLAEIGGRCEIQSAPGQGTTVEFVVPVKVGVS